MSQIKEEHIDIFPDWVIEIIRQEKLTIDIPTKLELTSSRNALNDKNDLEKLKPFIFNLVMRHVVSLAID
jgi:hypothetical protein